jgi:toxin CcdB
MARFDVYRHPDAALRKSTPYLIDLQNNHISGLSTRVVAPMRLAKLFGPPMRDLNPSFEIDGTKVILDAAALAAIPVAELRTPVANLQTQGEHIMDALDLLFGAY